MSNQGTNNPKLNRGIYSIQLVSQRLVCRKLIFIKRPQRLPIGPCLRVVYFQAPAILARRFFHTPNLKPRLYIRDQVRACLFNIRQN